MKNPDVYFAIWHIMQHVKDEIGDRFSGASVGSGFNVEDLVVDHRFLYYWFDKGTKRKNELKEFCIFYDTMYLMVLKHVSTR